MATWRNAWTEAPRRLYSPWGCKRLNTTEFFTNTLNFTSDPQLPFPAARRNSETFFCPWKYVFSEAGFGCSASI